MIGLVTPAAAVAATVQVTNSADSGPGSLRDVIAAAGDGDTVVIDPGVNPTLTSGAIQIGNSFPGSMPAHGHAVAVAAGNLTIDGAGARATTITGNGVNSIFSIDTGAGIVSISGLTLTGGGGSGSFGGGALVLGTGSLDLSDVALTNNRAGSQGSGGAILFQGATMTLDRVTVAANDSTSAGGGIFFDGSRATISNSTIASNTALVGGGLYVSGSGAAALVNDTLSGNGAGRGGDNLSNGQTSGTVTLQNTIVANSRNSSNCSGSGLISRGGNLEDTTPSQCGLSAGLGDLVGVNPLLSPPGDNGGPTDTMALAAGSPASDAVPASACPLSIDQRGLPRLDSSESACDIGAYEVQDSTPAALGCAPSSTPVGQPTTCTATVTNPAGALAGPPTGVVSFTSNGTGAFGAGSCTLSGSGGTSSCAVAYTPTAVGSGKHHLTASYGGDSTYAGGSASTDVAVTVRATALAVACAPSAIDAGQTTTCTATVTDPLGAGAGPPTGAVTFAAGGPGGFGTGGTCMLAGSGAFASCSVPFTPSATGAGTDTITAAYAGDAAHQLGSGSTSLAVKAATSTAVSCTPGTVAIGKSTTCTVTVRPARNPMTGSPTGSVSFRITGAGGVSGGGACKLVKARCSVTYTLSASASGTYIVTAAYRGDATHARASATTSLASAPVAGVAANVTVISGTVLIKLPKATSFVPLTVRAGAASGGGLVPLKGATVSVPTGSTIDTHRKGAVVKVATAADYRPATDRHHTVQTGTFAAAIFTIEQESARHAAQRLHRKRSRLRGTPATDLRLRTAPGAVSKAGCHRLGAPGKGLVRTFSGRAKGLFRTIGASSITTVRSAVWIVEDRCYGTLTEVGKGHATVTDLRHRHRPARVVGPGQGILIKGRFL